MTNRMMTLWNLLNMSRSCIQRKLGSEEGAVRDMQRAAADEGRSHGMGRARHGDLETLGSLPHAPHLGRADPCSAISTSQRLPGS